MELNKLESILATVAESCDRLDQRLQKTKDAYERMNHLAHQQLWRDAEPLVDLSLEDFHPTFGRQLLAPNRPLVKGQVLLREMPAIQLPYQLTKDHRPDWLAAWRTLSPSQHLLLEDFEANMEAVTESERQTFRLSEQEREGRRERHWDSLLHFRQVCRVNAQRLGLGAALFARASRLTHSCRPNCYTVEDGKVLELRCLRDLAPKEALNISYIADEKLLLQDAAARCRYLWKHHCFHCRCRRCVEEGHEQHAAASLSRAQVARWGRLEQRVGNLLKPQLEEQGWLALWRQLRLWQSESQGLSGHWAVLHASLLASYMAMQRHRSGFPLPLSVGTILEGFNGFLQLHGRVCPEVWWLTAEVQAQLRQLRRVLATDLDVALPLKSKSLGWPLELLLDSHDLNAMD